jgi:hypothetical protein
MNMYGFSRITEEGPSHGAYYHDLFRKNQPLLSTNIKRKPGTKRMGNNSKHPRTEEEPESTKPLPQTTSQPKRAISEAASSKAVSSNSESPPTSVTNSFGSGEKKKKTKDRSNDVAPRDDKINGAATLITTSGISTTGSSGGGSGSGSGSNSGGDAAVKA